MAMNLPQNAELAGKVPAVLKPILDADLTGPKQSVALQLDRRTCGTDGQCAAKACDPSTAGCAYRYMVNDRLFNMSHVRVLKLGEAAEWQLTSRDVFAHPFHIHVNPFEVTRLEPNEEGKMVSAGLWKDTISLPTDGSSVTIRTRYSDFDGTFVLHCHILAHEDMGMMELVRIIP